MFIYLEAHTDGRTFYLRCGYLNGDMTFLTLCDLGDMISR